MAYVRAFYSLLVAVAIAAVASCTGAGTNEPRLSPVAALPKPSLPPWIVSISPTRTAQSLAQIRVIFAKPVTPVEALSGEGPRAVLDRVSIEPQLAGGAVRITFAQIRAATPEIFFHADRAPADAKQRQGAGF